MGAPSAFRASTWARFGGLDALGLAKLGDQVVADVSLQKAVSQVLSTLSRVINDLGLPPHLGRDEALEAFARHIGLPSRVLDWTKSPFTAAYFAASDDKIDVAADPDKRIAVYAMSSLFQQSASMKETHFLSPAAAGNANLLAQHGVLMSVPNETPNLLAAQSREPWTLGRVPSQAESRRVENHMVCITLPWALAAEVVRVLRRMNVHAGTVFPNQEGVAALVRELFAIRQT